jgi:hypothetical protein
VDLNVDLTEAQQVVIRCLRRAGTHYKFLLSVICSTSFKAYFDMITASLGQALLPSRRSRYLYDGYLRRFGSNISLEPTEMVVDAEAGVVDAEVDVDMQMENEASFEGVS